MINLEKFSKCENASKKESKKSPHTFVLEFSTGDSSSNPKAKSGAKVSCTFSIIYFNERGSGLYCVSSRRFICIQLFVMPGGNVIYLVS